MSGFEIAGLVLSTIPLIVEALDSYKAGKGRIAIFRKYGLLLDSLIRELKAQNVIFVNNIGAIFHLAGVELSHSAQNSVGLIDEAIADEDIQRYLGSAYDPFVRLIEAYRDNVDRIASKLEKPVAFFNPTARTYKDILIAKKLVDGADNFHSKLKFTMSKKEIDATVHEFGRCGQTFERFCNSYRNLEPIDRGKFSSRGNKIASSLVGVKAHAQRLFNVISGKWSDCHSTHEVNVRLDARLDNAKASGSRGRQGCVTFYMGIGAPRAGLAQGLPWFETLVDSTDERAATKKAAKVTFQVGLGEDAEETSKEGLLTEQVTNICKIISQAQDSSHDLTFLVDSQDRLRASRKGEHPAPILCTETRKPVTLASILDARFRTRKTHRLDRITRLRVAVILASTIFQLSDTAWMIAGPIKDRVLFPLHSNAVEESPRIDATHPFISTEHVDFSHNSNAPLKFVLLELGIVLLELWHNVSFEQFCAEKQITHGDEFYKRLEPAHRWFEETEGDMVGRHSKAVSSCIRCLSKDTNFDDRTFRSEMFESILRPLDENTRDVS
ncbi:MAG: hypothetical protein Q9162_003558 [Coniocarpon cinnabarinum]